VSVEIDPEPTPEEREALLIALAAFDRERDDCSAWWRAGLPDVADDWANRDFPSGESPSGLSPDS
jgi:hypothetical protein